ncbi:hypothetical protein [Azospirillum largimobile]
MHYQQGTWAQHPNPTSTLHLLYFLLNSLLVDFESQYIKEEQQYSNA